MGTITLHNFRTTSDITALVKLKDGGLAIDWSGLTGIKAWLYSDEQRAISGRFDVSVSQEDPTVLVCDYSAQKPQYLGINRIIVQAKYDGRTKTYDQPLCNLVRWTEDQAGEQITLDDPVVDVEIEVEDVSSSLIERLIAACIKATEEAQEVVDTSRGPRGFSAYEVAVQNGFEGTEEEWLLSLQGKSAYEIAVELGYEGTEEQWLASLVGPAGESAYQLAVDQGYEGTLAEWLASLEGPAGDSAYQVAVEEGFVGTKAQWLASLVGPQGLSAYQVAVVEGFEGSVSDWLASLVGPPGVTSCVITVDNTTSETPSATASVLNGVLTIHISGIKGNPGVGFDSVDSNQDGTINITLTNGDVMTLDLNHNHPQYLKYVMLNSESDMPANPDSTTLYMWPQTS